MRHVWVRNPSQPPTDPPEWVEGLLLRWEHGPDGLCGQVSYIVDDEGSPVLVTQVLPRRLIRPATSGPSPQARHEPRSSGRPHAARGPASVPSEQWPRTTEPALPGRAARSPTAKLGCTIRARCAAAVGASSTRHMSYASCRPRRSCRATDLRAGPERVADDAVLPDQVGAIHGRRRAAFLRPRAPQRMQAAARRARPASSSPDAVYSVSQSGRVIAVARSLRQGRSTTGSVGHGLRRHRTWTSAATTALVCTVRLQWHQGALPGGGHRASGCLAPDESATAGSGQLVGERDPRPRAPVPSPRAQK